MPSFGSGDLAQAFSRLSAVYRGKWCTDVLKHPICYIYVGIFMLRTGVTRVLYKLSDMSNPEQQAFSPLSPKGEKVQPFHDTNNDDTQRNSNNESPTIITEPVSDSSSFQLPDPPPLRVQFVNGKKLIGLRLTNGQTIETKRFVASVDNICPTYQSNITQQSDSIPINDNQSFSQPTSQICRLVAVIDSPLLPGGDSFQFSVAMFPSQHPIQIIQLNWNSGCCPVDHFMIYMTKVVLIEDPKVVLNNYGDPQLNNLINDVPSQYHSMIHLLYRLIQSK